MALACRWQNWLCLRGKEFGFRYLQKLIIVMSPEDLSMDSLAKKISIPKELNKTHQAILFSPIFITNKLTTLFTMCVVNIWLTACQQCVSSERECFWKVNEFLAPKQSQSDAQLIGHWLQEQWQIPSVTTMTVIHRVTNEASHHPHSLLANHARVRSSPTNRPLLFWRIFSVATPKLISRRKSAWIFTNVRAKGKSQRIKHVSSHSLTYWIHISLRHCIGLAFTDKLELRRFYSNAEQIQGRMHPIWLVRCCLPLLEGIMKSYGCFCNWESTWITWILWVKTGFPQTGSDYCSLSAGGQHRFDVLFGWKSSAHLQWAAKLPSQTDRHQRKRWHSLQPRHPK